MSGEISQSYMIIRKDKSPVDYLITVISVIMCVWHLHLAFGGGYESTFQRATTYLIGMSLVFLVFRDRDETGWRAGLSVVIFIAAVASFSYPIIVLEYFLDRLFLVDPTKPEDLFFGSIALLLTWEAARRTINLALPLISFTFVAYTYYGPYFPWDLQHKGASFSNIIDHQYMTTDGLYTLPVGVFSVLSF